MNRAIERIKYLAELSNRTASRFGLTDYLKGKQAAYEECIAILNKQNGQ